MRNRVPELEILGAELTGGGEAGRSWGVSGAGARGTRPDKAGVLALPVLYPGLEPRVTVACRASGVIAKCLASSLEALGERLGWFLESGHRWPGLRSAPSL